MYLVLKNLFTIYVCMVIKQYAVKFMITQVLKINMRVTLSVYLLLLTKSESSHIISRNDAVNEL